MFWLKGKTGNTSYHRNNRPKNEHICLLVYLWAGCVSFFALFERVVSVTNCCLLLKDCIIFERYVFSANKWSKKGIEQPKQNSGSLILDAKV